MHAPKVKRVGSSPSSPVTWSKKAPSPSLYDLRVCSLLPAWPTR